MEDWGELRILNWGVKILDLGFGLRVMELVDALPNTMAGQVIGSQLRQGAAGGSRCRISKGRQGWPNRRSGDMCLRR